MSLKSQSRLNIGSNYIIMSGGTAGESIYITINNSNQNAIIRNSTGHIISENEYQKIKWFIGNNTGNYVFPFGVGSNYIPINFNITNSGSGSGNLTLSTWYTLDNVDVPDGGYFMCPSENSAIDRFWNITSSGYTSNPNSNIRFYYNLAELDGIPEMSLVAQNGDLLASPCPWDNPTGYDNSTFHYVEIDNITSYNFPWTLTNSLNPLPIELLDFNTKWYEDSNNSAIVYWSTATESNNDFFELERSSDGVNFILIKTINGAGNSLNKINYSFIDLNPIKTSVSYYRLKQVDFNGSYKYSKIQSLVPDITNNPLTIYPNPASNELYLSKYSMETEIINVTIYDLVGSIVYSKCILLNSEFDTTRLDISDFPSGTYNLTVKSDKSNITKKLIIIK